MGGTERTLAGLVDDDFARLGIELIDDVVTALAANQDSSHRAGIADALVAAAADDLRRRTIGQIRAVALARVDHHHAALARCLEHAPAWRDHALQWGDIVAECFAEAAPLDEVALHIDDDQRRRLRIELELV